MKLFNLGIVFKHFIIFIVHNVWSQENFEKNIIVSLILGKFVILDLLGHTWSYLIYKYMFVSVSIYLSITAEQILSVAIERWPEFWTEFSEPMLTEFCSDALTNWAIRPWVQLAHWANFVQLLQFHVFVQSQISFWLLPSSVATFANVVTDEDRFV